MPKRKIIKIDEGKCNGCGLCIPNCREGALQIIDGKARLVNDLFCDGLGACLGHCPQGAITVEEREAPGFDEKKALVHLKQLKETLVHEPLPCGCPGTKVIDARKEKRSTSHKEGLAKEESQLRQWPVQIALVPAYAPYLNNADLLIAADCVPFAYADFHRDLLKGKILLVGCPKLDDLRAYKEKFTGILKNNHIKSLTYAHMEVPCCFGLVNIIQEAIAESGRDIPFRETIISLQGEKIK